MIKADEITIANVTAIETKGTYVTDFPGSRKLLFRGDDAEQFQQKIAEDLKASERLIPCIMNKETVIIECNGYKLPVHFSDGKVITWLDAAEAI